MGRATVKRQKLSEHFRGSVFEWLALTPSAWQVVVVLLAGHIVPGLLGVLIERWREFTYGIWREVAHLISLDISGLEDIFDLYTLALLMLLAAAGTALRRKPNERANLRDEYQQAGRWRKRRIALRAAFIVTIYIVLFSISGASDYLANNGTSGVYGLLFIVYSATFLFTYVGAEYYFGFPAKSFTQRVEADRKNGVHSAWFVFAWPGLATYALSFTVVSFFGIAMLGILPPMNYHLLYLQMLAIWFLCFWLTHIRLNWPTAASIVEFTQLVLNVIFLSGLTVVALAPFAWSSIEARGSGDTALIGGLMIGGAFALVLGFAQVLRVDWRITRTILAIVFVIVIGDQVAGFVASLAPDRP